MRAHTVTLEGETVKVVALPELKAFLVGCERRAKNRMNRAEKIATQRAQHKAMFYGGVLASMKAVKFTLDEMEDEMEKERRHTNSFMTV